MNRDMSAINGWHVRVICLWVSSSQPRLSTHLQQPWLILENIVQTAGADPENGKGWFGVQKGLGCVLKCAKRALGESGSSSPRPSEIASDAIFGVKKQALDAKHSHNTCLLQIRAQTLANLRRCGSASRIIALSHIYSNSQYPRKWRGGGVKVWLAKRTLSRICI